MVYTIDDFRIYVRDLMRAKEFYAGVMGLRLQLDGAQDGFLVFDVGGPSMVVEEEKRDGRRVKDRVGRFVGVTFRVDDIDEALETLASHGEAFPTEPVQDQWGSLRAQFADPDGNVMTLVQYE